MKSHAPVSNFFPIRLGRVTLFFGAVILTVATYLVTGKSASAQTEARLDITGPKAGQGQRPRSPRENWRLQTFPLGSAGWQPSPTDPEYWDYSQIGFNTVLTPRDDFATPEQVSSSLAEAARHGLWVIIDTYTNDDRPWGGVRPDGRFSEGGHHPATEAELRWLVGQFSAFPRLVGFWLGDDLPADFANSAPRAAITQSLNYLRDQRPDLIPWVDHNYLFQGFPAPVMRPHNLAIGSVSLDAVRSPIHSAQLYPLDGTGPLQWRDPILRDLAQLARSTAYKDKLMWPIIRTEDVGAPAIDTRAWVRFQAYSSLAYGAQGLWYFAYKVQTGLVNPTSYTSREQIQANRRPNWPVVQEINHDILAWQTFLLTHRCARVYDTCGVGRPPRQGELVVGMDNELLVGVLVPSGTSATTNLSPLAIIVDCRVGEGSAPRDVAVNFNQSVQSVTSLPNGSQGGHLFTVPGLAPGKAVLVQLRGNGLASLSRTRMPVGPDGVLIQPNFLSSDPNRAVDLSGTGNDLELHSVTSGWGGAMHFDGQTSFGLVQNGDFPATDTMTVAFWLRPQYPQAPLTYFPILGFEFNGPHRFEIGLGPDALYPVVNNGQPTPNALYVNGVQSMIPPNLWTHLVYVIQGGAVTAYVDGARWNEASRTLPSAADFRFSDPTLFVGRRDGDYYHGDLTGLRIWNRALSDVEVRQLFKQGRSERPAALDQNQIFLGVRGPAGVTHRVQRSVDLVGWQEIGRLDTQGFDQPVPLADPLEPTASGRFYRTVTPNCKASEFSVCITPHFNNQHGRTQVGSGNCALRTSNIEHRTLNVQVKEKPLAGCSGVNGGSW